MTGMEPSRASRRERRKQATRRELLRAGRKLFSERGLYEVRIDDLAEHADIAKGTVYLYFHGKEALVYEVVSEAIAELSDFVRHRAPPAGRAERFASLVLAHAEFFEEHPDVLKILHQVRGLLQFDQPEWRPLREPLVRHLSFLSGLLAGAPKRRVTRSHHDLALILFGSVSGVASMHAALGRKATVDLWPAIAGALASLSGRRRTTGRE